MKVVIILPVKAQEEKKLVFLLLVVAELRHITGNSVEPWVIKVHTKLHHVNMDNVEEMECGLMVLNRKLNAARFSMMHHLTMVELMARKGIEVIMRRRPIDTYAPSKGTKLGQCMASDGFGALHTLCCNCEDSWMLHDQIEVSNRSSVLSHLSEGPALAQFCCPWTTQGYEQRKMGWVFHLHGQGS
jgi:hypothetical protein